MVHGSLTFFLRTSFLPDSHRFANFTTDLHSSNIPIHYGNVLEVTREIGTSIGLSQAYLEKAEAGLKVWKENSAKNIVWGFIAAQKTHKVDLDSIDF